LRELLRRRLGQQALESQLAVGLGMNLEEFWTKIDRLTVSHFEPGL
jgi:hypothetical protein